MNFEQNGSCDQKTLHITQILQNLCNFILTIAFTDADGNVITSVVDGVLANTTSADGGVTIVTTDSLAGSHFLSAAGDTVTKIEIDDDNINQMELMNPTSSPSASTSKGIKKGKVVTSKSN